ncbi:MAG TPA: hypothetical protein VFB39_16610 [Solirubrobacteraceae bacterium]|nr:hypothetical protein [Solirubrobacteraceae bacterium]
MSVDSQLQYEARVRTRQAVVAGAAAVLLLGSAVIQLAGPHTTVSEVTLGLIFEHRRFALDIVGAVLQAGGWAALAWTLWFLFRCTRAREERVQRFIGYFALAGAPLAAIGIIGYVISYGVVAQQFVTHGAQTYPQANQLMGAASLSIFQIIDYLGELLLAVGFVMVSLNAMRVGLLTRFLGFLGIIGGVLTLFVITPVPIVQFYWLAALAYLFTGRWPSGVPPAWRSGRAERWPSAQEARQQQARARGQGGRAKALTRDAVPEPVGAGGGGGGSSSGDGNGSTRSGASRSNKRKRKRRR